MRCKINAKTTSNTRRDRDMYENGEDGTEFDIKTPEKKLLFCRAHINEDGSVMLIHKQGAKTDTIPCEYMISEIFEHIMLSRLRKHTKQIK